jgi:hypothetical protein
MQLWRCLGGECCFLVAGQGMGETVCSGTNDAGVAGLERECSDQPCVQLQFWR